MHESWQAMLIHARVSRVFETETCASVAVPPLELQDARHILP
jgi:hypothetical protein